MSKVENLNEKNHEYSTSINLLDKDNSTNATVISEIFLLRRVAQWPA